MTNESTPPPRKRELDQVEAKLEQEEALDESSLALPGDAAPPLPDSTMESKIVISPRLVAVGSFIFGVGCLAALAFVGSVHNANTLATIALALAIVSFGVQLIASAAQNQATTQQSIRSEQLNTQTQALLVEMQTSARATERMVREQFGQLLRAFLDAAKSTERGKDFDPAEFEEKLMANIRREALVARSPSSSTAADRVRSAETERRARQRTAVQRAAEEQARERAAGPFPSEEEAQAVLPDLLVLDAQGRARLRQYAQDKIRAEISDTQGWYEGFPLRGDGSAPSVDSQLAERGLLHVVRLREDIGGDDEGLAYQLTDKGLLGSRILNATGPVPDWALPLFEPGEPGP